MESDPVRTLQAVPDDELLRFIERLVAQSRGVEADLIDHIAEADERRLYARQAFPSMFAYCTQALHLSEAEAFRRITVARAARRHPALLTALAEGRVHLSGLALLVPLVTADNCAGLLERAAHRSKREIEELVAELAPRAAVPASIRKLPERRDTKASIPSPGDRSDRTVPGSGKDAQLFPGTAAAARTPDSTGQSAFPPAHEREHERVEPLSPARYKVQFTASAGFRDKLERLKALMRREVPSGDFAEIIERAVSEKLERLEARRFAKAAAPRKSLTDTVPSARSRHLPAAVRRAVHERDQGRCRFVDEDGRRCSERLRLEFHHRHPFGMGGDHSLSNISLLCAAHNRYLAERDYGAATIRRNQRDAT